MGFERGVLAALAARPVLALEALRTMFAMRGKGGIAPSAEYLRWRTSTAYGDQKVTISERDLLHYLNWRRQMRGIRKGERWG